MKTESLSQKGRASRTRNFAPAASARRGRVEVADFHLGADTSHPNAGAEVFGASVLGTHHPARIALGGFAVFHTGGSSVLTLNFPPANG